MYPKRCRVSNVTGAPFHRTSPESANSTPIAIRMEVVLPAPFAPTKPNISPGRTLKVRSCRATVSPYRLVTRSNSSIGPLPADTLVPSGFRTFYRELDTSGPTGVE